MPALEVERELRPRGAVRRAEARQHGLKKQQHSKSQGTDGHTTGAVGSVCVAHGLVEATPRKTARARPRSVPGLASMHASRAVPATRAARAQADWSIVERGYQAHILGEAPNTYTDAVEAIQDLRAKSGDPENPVSDQHLEPFVIVDDDGKAVGPVQVRAAPPRSLAC